MKHDWQLNELGGEGRVIQAVRVACAKALRGKEWRECGYCGPWAESKERMVHKSLNQSPGT